MRSTPFALGAVVVALAVGASAPTASAATPCWKTVIADWAAHGSIVGTYPSSCYRQAMQNAPTDLKIYSTLEDDLRAALRQHSARRLATAPTRTMSMDLSGSASSFPVLVALVAGLGLLLGACTVAAAIVRRRAARHY